MMGDGETLMSGSEQARVIDRWVREDLARQYGDITRAALPPAWLDLIAEAESSPAPSGC